jgi:hypothetical protein
MEALLRAKRAHDDPNRETLHRDRRLSMDQRQRSSRESRLVALRYVRSLLRTRRSFGPDRSPNRNTRGSVPLPGGRLAGHYTYGSIGITDNPFSSTSRRTFGISFLRFSGVTTTGFRRAQTFYQFEKSETKAPLGACER